MKINKNNLGFTLIELTVAVLILAVLSSIIINMVSQSQAKSQADLTKVKTFDLTAKNKLIESLIGEWNFDEGSGSTASNSSDYGSILNGTIYNATYQANASCVSGSCLYFNGTSAYVDLAVGSSDGLSVLNSVYYPFTVEFWVKLDQGGVGQAIWGGYTAGGQTKNFIITNTSNQINFDQYAPSGNTFTPPGPALALSQWYHVTMSIASTSDCKLYINGVLYIATALDAYSGTTPEKWSIGRRYMTTSGNYLKGYLDEVRVFSAALTTIQVQEQYYAGLNKLLANKGITKQEYNQRVAALQAEIAKNDIR